MISWLALILLLAFGPTIRLYLKDGSYQLTNEYKIQADRISYFSTERGDWEELPLDLVDLPRTKKEAAEREEAIKAEAKEQAAEDAADRAARREVEQIPIDPGVYYIHGDKLEAVKVAESKIVTNKRRQVLKVLSPIPLVPGKAVVELDGESSSTKIADARPEFFFRLATFERFGILKLTPKKGVRIVENLQIVPVTKEIVLEQQMVDTFKKQVGDNVYRIWPEKPLEPGEYALVEFTDGTDSVNIQVWDFCVTAK